MVLRLAGDFRAIAVTQHLLGVLTAGLMLLAWQRGASLVLGERRAASWPVRLAGLLTATTYLTARSAVLMEHFVRPEAVLPFFVMASIGLNLEFIRRRWVTREYGVAAWLGAAAAVLSMALYQLKPSFGFAVIFVNAPLLLALVNCGMPQRQKVWLLAGALGGSACLLTPEILLRRADPLTNAFLPNTLLTVHADMIRDQIGEDLASGRPLPFPRDLLTALHARLGTLLVASATPEDLGPYVSLGFNPDCLLHTDYVFAPLLPIKDRQNRGAQATARRRAADISFYYYHRSALHHPIRMLGKISRQLAVIYRFKSFSPAALLDTRDPYLGEKETPVARYYQENVRVWGVSLPLRRYETYAPGQKYLADSERLTSSRKKISQRPLLSISQNLLVALHFPGLIAALGLGMWAVVTRPGRWQLPFGVWALLASYNFGNSLTIAVVHSLDVGRYVSNQLSFTLLSSAFSLLFVGGMFGSLTRTTPAPEVEAGLPTPSLHRYQLNLPLPSLCVLIPCYNEALSIGAVVSEYRAVFPQARLLVVDNASSDGTALAAHAAGAEVCFEGRRGKARAVLTALDLVDSDLILMVDGDGSYPAEGGLRLVRAYVEQPTDLLTGVRRHEEAAGGSFRPLHQGGTRVFGRVLRWVFGFEPADLFSGLRLLSQRFYRNVPILSRGFELELELTVQAIDKGFTLRELPVPFGLRAEGTRSKLRTVRDGLRILRFLVVLARDYRPLLIFGTVAACFCALSILAGFLPVAEFLTTQYVTHVPLAVLAASLMVLAFGSLQTGLVLESGLRYNREAFQHRLRQPAVPRVPGAGGLVPGTGG